METFRIRSVSRSRIYKVPRAVIYSPPCFYNTMAGDLEKASGVQATTPQQALGNTVRVSRIGNPGALYVISLQANLTH